jgi:hypothetical protein
MRTWPCHRAYYIRGSTPFHSCVEVRSPKLVSSEDRTGARALSASYCSTEGVAPLHTAPPVPVHTAPPMPVHTAPPVPVYTAPPVPVTHCANSAGTHCATSASVYLPMFRDDQIPKCRDNLLPTYRGSWEGSVSFHVKR